MLIAEFTDNENQQYPQTAEGLSTKFSNMSTYLRKAKMDLC